MRNQHGDRHQGTHPVQPVEDNQTTNRRAFLRLATGAVAAGVVAKYGLPTRGEATPIPATLGPELMRLPEKVDLLLHTGRPPNLETPLRFFREDITPNEAFYVRWHLADVPTRVDTATFRLSIHGHVEQPVGLSVDDLKTKFEAVSVVAVNQCSGNSRSLFEPRMPGVQWGNGAIGNAKWTGVRLKDLLAQAKVKPGAVDVTFNGLDGPVLPAADNFAGTPDFIKSLSIDHATDGEVIVAYAMNDQPLPMVNGFPLRLVVPGWYATYWVKALNEITVLNKPFDGFWMAKAYRVPSTPDFQEAPKELAKETVPISRMVVRSLFVRPEPAEAVAAGKAFEVQGLALDGGSGIKRVELSTDGGRTWADTRLDPEIGRYSWRRWRFNWTPAAGTYRLMVRATSAAGETQLPSQWNRSGYARKVIESVDVVVS